jgi:RHS repeat-associated protein
LSSISNTPRGFTQHEHLNSVELIHMNGRAFDYNLGRFLSVDPIIQFPTNSQSLNPYSYIMNNPLAGTDPTGYEACDVGANKSCLEDGVNTITKGGKTIATVIVGQKGDNIAFSGSGFNVGNLKYVSNGINLALNPANGAENWVKSGPSGSKGPSDIGSAGGRGKGCAGGGPLQCYSVTSQKIRGRSVVTSFERTFDASGAYGAVNGIVNRVGRAMELMASHVQGRYGASSFLLAHNPTEGFARDLWESTRDKLGWTTAAASQFADILAAVDHPMSWVAHSQGGAIFSEAMRYNLNRGVTDMSNIRVAFHAGANNRWMTNRYAARGGVGVVGYYDAPNDLVPQVIGLRAWNRPDRFLRSIFSAPSLFGDSSPHTYAVDPEH